MSAISKGLALAALVMLASYARAQNHALSNPVGRYIIQMVETPASGNVTDHSGKASGPMSTLKMLIMLDTATGRTWQYRAFYISKDDKTVGRQYGWVPLKNFDVDILEKISDTIDRQNNIQPLNGINSSPVPFSESIR